MREGNEIQRRLRGAALAAALLLATPAFAEPAAATPQQGEMCPAAAERSADLNGEAAELMRRVAEQDLQAGQNPSDDADTIVLTNRGFNYGRQQGVQFDPIAVELPPTDPHAQ